MSFPTGQYGVIYADPYLELFARTKRSGWTVWGNETDKFQEVDSCR